jgi:hypothetical protein
MGWCDLLLYRNLGDGSLAPAQLIQHRPYGGAATAAADVDGDGRADIVFTLRSPGMTTIGVMLNRTP